MKTEKFRKNQKVFFLKEVELHELETCKAYVIAQGIYLEEQDGYGLVVFGSHNKLVDKKELITAQEFKNFNFS